MMGPQMVSREWDRMLPCHLPAQVSAWLPSVYGSRKQIPSTGSGPPLQFRSMDQWHHHPKKRLEMHLPSSYPKPTETETLGQGPEIRV